MSGTSIEEEVHTSTKQDKKSERKGKPGKDYKKKKGGPPEVDIDQVPPQNLLVEDADCTACANPCDDHSKYPSYLDIDRESPLLGSLKSYGRQILIGTGKSDWPNKIEEEEGTLVANLKKILCPMEWVTAVNNTSLISRHSTKPGAVDVIVVPDNILIGNVGPDDAQLLYDVFVSAPLPTGETDSVGYFQSMDLQDLTVEANPYESMILICSHKRRDKRCGVTAPILGREFDHVLRELDISDGEGGTIVLMVSHIGGHRYAGNVVCYINNGSTGIWYGRVDPCHCKAIVEETIMQGKVIKSIYRGAMKHSFGENKCDRYKW
ncbi:hypothetical protein K501DRAFT_187112 [Backusella circina FSU 941]|nr:hypothetical protein K501DRAFT_200241 [Backusella circina FSU 941]KAI8882267.1 hypothetical protein K501DRAFT_187112 [Backusella circina FSU 941]